MAGKQMTSDSFTANLAGMSKNQLYDIMSQMKILIEQNQQQARQILVDNPALTKALFQAQIMLGMVQPPQAIPSIQQTISQPSQQSMQPGQPPSVQAQPVPVQVGRQEQTSTVQPQMPSRKKQPNQSVPPIPSASTAPVTHQPQAMPSHSLQSMQPSRHMNTLGNSMSLPPSSQGHTMPPQPLHSAQQPLQYHQQVSSQPQQSLHSSSAQHPPLQPPLPPQPRPPPMQPFQHQFHSQMGPHGGFQPSGPPQSHHSQQSFNAGNKHPGGIGFTQGQPPLPNQPLPQSLYQVGGSHLGADYNNQGGNSMQVDRGSWMPGPPENAMGGAQLPGPPPLPAQMGPGSQPPRQSQLSPDMENALQQVMSLTPEQINLLPPEQRQQVLQLQQMMR
ncbi:hypothetical protein AQUCO_02600306v1 [Aquilegia coerulea]|uniref:Cleavage stimulation factor subunit 2 hinge domain-containing protein n=1 Tax=Aquilegia coerulea TaxID=218851 RepID=A0A2G5D8C6_AQUCA|nr:hypothetical protein AQUCO_02600306v1 [Aquilegia coerulea]